MSLMLSQCAGLSTLLGVGEGLAYAKDVAFFYVAKRCVADALHMTQIYVIPRGLS